MLTVSEVTLRGRIHVTFACACACDAKNGLHDTKWRCLHLMLTFVCHAKNWSDTHSVHLHLHFHSLNAKGDVAYAHTHTQTQTSCVNRA